MSGLGQVVSRLVTHASIGLMQLLAFLPLRWIRALGWGLGAATVGIAGVMLITFYYVSPTVGANFAVIAYVTVALGGFGSILGALVAGIVIGEVEALTALLLEPSLKQVGMFVVYLAVLMVRPRGLFGRL